MGLFEKLKDWLMPLEVEDDYEEEEEEKVVKKAEAPIAREEAAEAVAVNASSFNTAAPRNRFTTNSVRDFHVEQTSAENNNTKLSIHKSKSPNLNMEVYAPQNFDQVRSIGDQLKKKNAVVVNYEMLDIPNQRRICDFLNGLIYVLDGNAKRVSNNIVLYVPNGVDIDEAFVAA